MNSKYEDIFNRLIKAYYEDRFEETVNDIIINHEISPQETFKIVCTLCGVSLDFDNNYLYKLKNAITNYEVNRRFIEKLDSCNIKCKASEDVKTSCQLACPFDAILYDKDNNSTYIDYDLCLGCGNCIEHCKDGKIMDVVEFLPVLDLIKNNKKVIAAVAPAIAGQFGEKVTLDMLREAFIKIGFTDMIEVAFTADMLTINEAVQFNRLVKEPDDLMITSCCCPMWVGMLKKVYNDLVPNLSPSVSPMIAAGRVIKKLDPEAKVVFIGPCIAKKAEAKEADIGDAIDYVLTFQELDQVFKAFDLNLESLKGIPSRDYASRGGRLYARSGGVSLAVYQAIQELYPEKAKFFKAIKAEGVKECKEVLKNALASDIDANFIEGMGCVGGCVGGPKAIISKEEGRRFVDDYAFNSPIKVSTHSVTFNEVLKRLNINSLEDFKNEEKTAIFHREF